MDNIGRILIVENNKGIRKRLALIVRSEGYQASVASCGEEALHFAKKKSFDLAIIGIHLADMIGTDLLSSLKEIQPEIITILTTSNKSLETAKRALKQGASAYIEKPLNAKAVLATLREFFEKKFLIEEKKLVEQALVESEARYRLFYENSINAYALQKIITNEDGIPVDFVFLETNHSFEKQTGFKSDQIIGKKASDILPPIEANFLVKTLGKVAQTGNPIQFEFNSPKWDKYYKISAFCPFEGHCATTFFDVSVQRESESEITRQLEDLTILQAISAVSIEARDENELIERVTRLLSDKFYSDHIGFLLLDPDKGELYPHPSYRGISKEDFQIPLNLGECITGLVASSGKSLRIDDIRERDDYLPNSNSLLRSEVCVPIRNNLGIIGVINAESQDVGAFSEQDERLLSTIADFIATSFERVRSFQAERQQKIEALAQRETTNALVGMFEQEQVLNSILDSLEKVIHFSSANVLIKDGNLLKVIANKAIHPGNGTELVIPTSDQLFQSFSRNKKTIIVADIEKDQQIKKWKLNSSTRSLLVSPLIDRDEIIGLMMLGNNLPGIYQAHDGECAISFANQAASAIVKSRLLSETHKRLENMQTMYNIDRVIATSEDLKLTLNILMERITSSLGVDAATVLFYQPNTQILEYISAKGLDFRSPRIFQQKLGEGLAGEAALTGKIVMRSGTDCPIEPPLQMLKSNKEYHFYCANPLIVKGEIKGVLEIYNQKSFKPDHEWLDFLNALSTQTALAIENQALFDDLQRTNHDLMLAYDLTLEGWASAMELRDKETMGHSRRVVKLTLELARALELDEEELVHIRRGAYLHDIGKMVIPDNILQKPGKLNHEEWEIMRRHPIYAYKLLSKIPYLKPAMDIPYCHHEKWDGTGYPRGLKGEQIPLSARIFAIVDVYDALRSDRPYRNAWEDKQNVKYLQEQAGKHFEPSITDAFLQLIKNNHYQMV